MHSDMGADIAAVVVGVLEFGKGLNEANVITKAPLYRAHLTRTGA